MSAEAGQDVAVVGILTVSDRASTGEYKDLGGPAVVEYVTSHFVGPPSVVTKIVPDEREDIASAIKELSARCDLVLTTGGTGPAPRDVTPEATCNACVKLLPGFGERMRMATVERVPTAILARQTAGVCGEALVINLPGSVKAIPECLDAVLLAISHAVRLVGAKRKLTLLPEFHRTGSFCKDCDVMH